MFDALGEKFEGVFRKLRGVATLTEDNMKDALREVRMALLEADVNYVIVKDFIARVREQALGADVVKGVNPAQQLFAIVHKELVAMIEGDAAHDRPFEISAGSDAMILMLGLQGAGKTTFCGKLAAHLRRERGCKPMLVACDVYRPAAVEQLKQVGAGLKIPVFEMGTDHPVVEVVRAARKRAAELGCDVLIVDTAGRLHIDEVKMEELQGLRDKFHPDYTFLVADAMTGQDAVNSAKAFNDQVGIDGVCLTKLDGDARGGAALSIKAVTGKPIVFVGVGEKSDDLEQFHAERVAQRILGMGDVVSLVEKAQKAIDEKEVESLRDKLGEGSFNYNDFVKQMRMIKRMGSLKGLLGMLPGVGSMMRGIDGDVLDKELKRVESMILSMTKEERENPDLVRIEGRRRERIAKGSGHTLRQLNELVKQFEQMRSMMQQMAGGTGMFSQLKGMMGGGEGQPDPGAILGAGGAMPNLPQGPVGPGMPGYKQYRKQMREFKKQTKTTLGPTTNRERTLSRKKNKRKSKG